MVLVESQSVASRHSRTGRRELRRNRSTRTFDAAKLTDHAKRLPLIEHAKESEGVGRDQGHAHIGPERGSISCLAG